MTAQMTWAKNRLQELAFVVGCIIVVVCSISIGAGVIDGFRTPFNTPCPTEDSTGCYWDADTMGNGHGNSFVVDYDGTTYYR